MLLNTRKKRGQKCYKAFTLVELLVAVAIVGIISVISVQSLYDAVSIRAKQYSIEDSSDDVRSIVKLITKEVMEGKNIKIPSSHEILITGDEVCSTIKYDSGVILHAQVKQLSCTPPTMGLNSVSSSNIEIIYFSFTPVSDSPHVITLKIEGIYKNSLGNHPFKYQTTITPRVSL